MTGKLHVNFVTDMEKLGISRPRSLLLARRIVATVIPGLPSIWRHAVRQFIMASHGEGWDDPGPRQPGFRPGPRRAGPQAPPSGQSVAPPRWARQHLSELEEARRLQSLGDERTADQLMLAVISLLGPSYTTRVRRFCGVPAPRGIRGQPAAPILPATVRGWHVLQREEISLAQERVAHGDIDGASRLLASLSSARPTQFRDALYALCNLRSPTAEPPPMSARLLAPGVRLLHACL